MAMEIVAARLHPVDVLQQALDQLAQT